MAYKRKFKSRLGASLKKRRTLRSRMGTKLARFAQSRFRYKKGRKFSKAAASVAETKLLSVNPYNEQGASAIQVGALAYYVGFYVGGTLPTGWDASLKPLGGILTAQGTSGANRIGNYIYLKQTHINLNIDMNFTSSQRPPSEFRMIVCKQNRATMPAGVAPVPQTSLFLNTTGGDMGYQTVGVRGFDMMRQPLNKRDWYIKTDRHFTLTNPMKTGSDGSQVGYSGAYKSRKSLTINLPYFKKTHINLVSNVPDDLDYRWVIYFFANNIGSDQTSAGWEVNLRGTTAFTDL